MDWKDISLTIGGFVSGLLFNLFVKVLPTYVDLSKENQELREKVRELESALEDERDRRHQESERPINTKELQAAISKLRKRHEEE